MFGDDAARVVVFVKAFQPLMAYRPYHPRTVTRYITQGKNNVSKIVAFLSAGAIKMAHGQIAANSKDVSALTNIPANVRFLQLCARPWI